MSSSRDEFSRLTRQALAGRAGHRCSICKTPTIGPSDESPSAVMDVGVAAHITAAAPGPGARRYDPFLTPKQRSGVENGIWLCQTCSVIVDRDAMRFSVSALQNIRRDHTEFVRLGARVDTDVGLVAIGPEIIAGGQIVRFDAGCLVVRLSFFLQGSADDLLVFVRRFDAHVPLSRYVLLSEPGVGGLLAEAPVIEREGAAWTMTCRWQPDQTRLPASRLAGMSRHTGEMISGDEYWREYFEAVLGRPSGTWFADIAGGSHLSELYEGLRGSLWFEHLVKCELVRLACIPAPARPGSPPDGPPPFQCVRRVLGVRVSDPALIDEHLRVEVEFELEGYGRWLGDLSLFIYSEEGLRAERAKALWISENILRADTGRKMLPTPTPPAGWRVDDGFPE